MARAKKSVDAGASALTQGSASGATTHDEVKKEQQDREKEEMIQVKTNTPDDNEEMKKEEVEEGRTAARIMGNEFSPVAAAVAGAGCPFLNRG